MRSWLCVLLVGIASAFDVSWTPADLDGDLPSSKTYLDKLARLCGLLKSGDLPKSLPRASIEQQCRKLSEKMVGSDGGWEWSWELVFGGLVLVGAVMVLATHQQREAGQTAAGSRASAAGPTREELKRAADRFTNKAKANVD
eukprot:TRINITY_DN9197_c0_g1_i3.p3 TRINITY_DN9197_c0_g1~~TRINITY_DN9197_c0_g1_i3.p3  ORF type:complete len:142 (+),score=34.62 TRINITY_DN9197_c0_g1_i3:158-583(+)